MPFPLVRIKALAVLVLIALTGSVAAQDVVYEVDDLNVGLGSASADLDRSSPRSSIEALLDLASDSDFDAMAHLLNLGMVAPDQQATRGPNLAEQLYTVIDRKVVIKWGTLLDRPDGLDTRATSDSAVAGQARRSKLLSIFTIDGRPYPIYLDRVQVEGEDPVWVFRNAQSTTSGRSTPPTARLKWSADCPLGRARMRSGT